MSEDLTGRSLGHYRVDEVLGRGGMSVLYRATDVRLGRKVALKVMGEHITGDAEFRERFADEARNTSAIDHANVVPLYDFGEVDGMLYIAMRLVDGSDLASLVQDGPISAQRALDLLGQVAEALDLLHERGLVHLDLKPANVLVTSRESAARDRAGGGVSHGPAGEHVYLADFGLTRRGATGHHTTSGDFLGSPNYAAPEHLRGEPVEGRTDLYALACMLFTCLTGRPPFQGQVPEVVQGHLWSEPPAVTSFVVLPRAVDDVVRRGMAKTPEGRFADCRELIAAARTALAPASGDRGAGPAVAGPAGRQPARWQTAHPPQSQSPPQPQSPPQGYPSRQVPGRRPPDSPSQQGSQHGPQQGRQPFPPPPSFPKAPPQPNDDPVRLRPPMPARPSSFHPSLLSTKSRRKVRWLVPLLVLAVLSGLVVAVVALAGTSAEGIAPR